jgi:hypothetical protein
VNPLKDVRATVVAAGIGAVALVAGIAIAGLPGSVPNDIAMSDIAPTIASSTSTIGGADSSQPAQTPATVSDSEPTMTTETTERPPVTTSQTTLATPPTTVTPSLVPESQLRVVVANAGGADGLAARFSDVVRGFGYASVEPANALSTRDASTVYWSGPREAEARRLGEQLGVSAVEPLPPDPVVLGNFIVDLWVIVGLDLRGP